MKFIGFKLVVVAIETRQCILWCVLFRIHAGERELEAQGTMARFACQGDSEPLMRLERPSTASSQTTAHIVNACFNEILSSKQLDSKDINNLVVSKRESIESDSDFQEFYVDRLTKVFCRAI